VNHHEQLTVNAIQARTVGVMMSAAHPDSLIDIVSTMMMCLQNAMISGNNITDFLM